MEVCRIRYEFCGDELYRENCCFFPLTFPSLAIQPPVSREKHEDCVQIHGAGRADVEVTDFHTIAAIIGSMTLQA